MDAWLLSSKDTCVWRANMPLTFDAESRLNTAALRPVGYALFNNTRHYTSMYIHWKREQKGVKSLNGLFSCITQRGRVIQRRNGDVGIYGVFLNATAFSWRWWHSTKSTGLEKSLKYLQACATDTRPKNRRGMEGKDRERESDGRWDATGVFQHGLVTERLCVCV